VEEREGFEWLLEERRVNTGDKLVLGSAAAGYSMVMLTGEWTGEASSPPTPTPAPAPASAT